MGVRVPAVDHLVVATASLADAVPVLADRLGAEPSGGATHARYGTHNALWALGGGTYLELIAVDPEAPAPGRPRWFGLDTEVVRRRIAAGPTLLHWVARPRTPGGRALPAWAAEHGEALRLARGDLAWTVTVPPDGSLPVDGTGVWPTLIAWDGAHPADALDDAALRLDRLVLTSPRAGALRARLSETGLAGGRVVVADGPPGLRAELRTPTGPLVL